MNRVLSTALAAALTAAALAAVIALPASHASAAPPVTSPLPAVPADPDGASVAAAPALAPNWRPALPLLPPNAHIVFVLDGSTTLDGPLNLEMRKSARRIALLVTMPHHSGSVDMGVVSFDRQAHVLCRPPVDVARLVGCLGSVRPRPGKDIAAGIEAGLAELRRQRSHPGVPDPNHPEVVVLMTDGPLLQRCDAPLAAATELRDNGVRLVVVAVGPRADLDCLGALTPQRHDFFVVAQHIRWSE